MKYAFNTWAYGSFPTWLPSYPLDETIRRLAQLNRDLLDALLWNFTVLGEAARSVSDEVKAGHPDVPWADPVRLRNRIVHGYWSVDLDVLTSTARDDLPALIEALERIRAAS